MKKITLLQSALALIAAFMLALPARAQVASAADLFGTYKFTADVNVTDAGQALKDNFKSECEVIITKCSYNIFDGEIQGLAGATAAQSINAVDVAANTIKITNPNGNGLWGGGLYMSNSEGVYPFGGNYNDILYTFDPATKTITLPDFTLVTCDHANSAATIAASFTNAKLTLVQSENIDVTDLSGDWHYTAGKGTYDTMEGSTLPTEWDMTLTATDDSKKAYNISLTLGDFAPLALTATFDGVTLTIPFNEDYFDAEQKIGLVNMYGVARPGTITFNMANENLLTLTSGMTIAQDSISPEVPGGYKQWYLNGSAKRQGGESAAFDWAGTFKVKAEQVYPVNTAYEYPAEFDMVVAYWEAIDAYYVSEFMGYTLPNGGFQLIPDENDPTKATFAAGTRFLTAIEAGVTYLTLGDINATESAINLTIKEDGTVSIADFCVNLYDYATKTGTPAGSYMGVTASKEVKEPFTWDGTFKVKANEVYDINKDYTYPSEFNMVITYWDVIEAYYVSEFMGYTLPNGGFQLIIDANDPNKATFAEGVRYLTAIEAGVTYLTLGDMNGTEAAINLTAGEDGIISIDNLCVLLYDYATKKGTPAGSYVGVTATKDNGETVEPEPFNWAQTFTVTADVQSYNDAYTYPTTFEMTVKDWGSGIYTIINFMGYDIYNLNGGAGFNVTSDTEAAIKAGAYIGIPESGKAYYTIADLNNQPNDIKVKVNEDGSLSIDNFCVNLYLLENSTTTLAAFYTNVKATVGPSSIENIEAAPALKAWSANGTIYVAGEAQAVEVYDMSGRTVFSGVASQVSGLNKGLYLVKVKNAVAKVAVK